MGDLRRLAIVARFELRDALRSKLVWMVVGLFAGGSALGSLVFIKALQGAEAGTREMIAQQTGASPDAVPMDQIKTQALQGIFSLFEDEGVRSTLMGMQPLAIFFGVAAIYAIPLLVLGLSAGAHASDIQSGAVRFTIFRCDRTTWAVGKMLGHLLLIALGLAIAALVSGIIGYLYQPEFSSGTWGDLLLSSLRAFFFAGAYLGIFSGLSLMTRAPLLARALSLAALFVCGVGHFLASNTRVLPSGARYFFPGHYEGGLWNADLAIYLQSAFALLLFGAVGFALGIAKFRRIDA